MDSKGTTGTMLTIREIFKKLRREKLRLSFLNTSPLIVAVRDQVPSWTNISCVKDHQGPSELGTLKPKIWDGWKGQARHL